jgi:NAD(P)H dehydrogenase (quinone)
VTRHRTEMGSSMTDPVKLAVVYYSATGTNTEIAKTLAEAAEKAGAEVRLRRVAELAPQEAIDSNPAWAANHAATTDIAVATPDDIDWADAVIFGSPTRFGNIASQLKQFIDTLGGLWGQGKLADKVYSGFVSSATRHGGQESTLLALYNSVHHFGGIVVAPGYTDPAKFADGNPYGTSHIDAQGSNPVNDETRASARVQAERVVRTAQALKAGAAV